MNAKSTRKKLLSIRPCANVAAHACTKANQQRTGCTVGQGKSNVKALQGEDWRTVLRCCGKERQQRVARDWLRFQQALHRQRAIVEDMRVDHRRLDIFMSHQLLHSANVVACFQEMRCKTMTEGVRRSWLCKSGSCGCSFDRLLYATGMQMVAVQCIRITLGIFGKRSRVMQISFCKKAVSC